MIPDTAWTIGGVVGSLDAGADLGKSRFPLPTDHNQALFAPGKATNSIESFLETIEDVLLTCLSLQGHRRKASRKNWKCSTQNCLILFTSDHTQSTSHPSIFRQSDRQEIWRAHAGRFSLAHA